MIFEHIVMFHSWKHEPVFSHANDAAIVFEPAEMIVHSSVNDSADWFVNVIWAHVLKKVHHFCSAWLQMQL